MKLKIVKIAIFVAISLVIAVTILSAPINNLDEIWNYNFSKNIADGNVPYRDFNVVQMPGLFMITSIFLKVIANEMIVTRILGIILSVALMFVTMKIFEKLKINNYISFLLVFAITYLLKDYFCLDYNFFNLLIVLILIFCEQKNLKNNQFRYNLLLGILAGSSILVKQTTGLFIVFACLLINILQIRKKEDVKIVLKSTLARIIGVIIPIFCMFAYITINGIWSEFIDYTILGIFTFSNKISYLNLIRNGQWYIIILSIIVPVSYIYMGIRFLIKKEHNILVLLGYSIANFIVVYPISDNIHFLIGSLPAIIGIIYIIYDLLNNIKNKYSNKKIMMFLKIYIKALLKILIYIITLVVIILAIRDISKIFSKNSQYVQLNHFKYIEISDNLLNRIKEVDNYILEKQKSGNNVYILDASAALYMIPIDKYTKNFDMFLKGNLGGRGEDGQIEDVKNKKQSYILILNDMYPKNWQTPTKVTDFVKDNMEIVDNIDIYDVYYVQSTDV